eukprot:UN02357
MNFLHAVMFLAWISAASDSPKRVTLPDVRPVVMFARPIQSAEGKTEIIDTPKYVSDNEHTHAREEAERLKAFQKATKNPTLSSEDLKAASREIVRQVRENKMKEN